MVKLNPGTVVFEDINQEMIKGQVLKPIEKNSRLYQKDPLDGRIRYRGKDRSEVCYLVLVNINLSLVHCRTEFSLELYVCLPFSSQFFLLIIVINRECCRWR